MLGTENEGQNEKENENEGISRIWGFHTQYLTLNTGFWEREGEIGGHENLGFLHSKLNTRFSMLGTENESQNEKENENEGISRIWGFHTQYSTLNTGFWEREGGTE